MSFEVIYLTGAPAAGKSSLLRALKARLPDLATFEYGAALTEYLRRAKAFAGTQSTIRELSATVVTPDDVQAVDQQLLTYVATERRRTNVIIDSHAVTQEGYGFRVTPFSMDQLKLLAPTQIWSLFLPPDVTIDRIRRDPAGRPVPTEWQAMMHTMLQSGLASSYSFASGTPLHLFDAGGEQADLIERLAARIQPGDRR